MQFLLRTLPGMATISLLALSPALVRAQTGLLNHNSANFASHDGNIAYLGLGIALPLLTDGAKGTDHAFRTADAFATGALLSEGIKQVVHEQRPDGTSRDRFPSGHATAAFAVAAMESHYHRASAPLWYLGAAAIADSRVTLRRHYPHDVIAGGLLGIGSALLELHSPRGLLLSPFLRSEPSHPHSSFYGLLFRAPLPNLTSL